MKKPAILFFIFLCMCCTIMAQKNIYRGLDAPFGVNLSSAEFGPQDSPPYGVEGEQYDFPSAKDLDYFKSKGLKMIRFPFRWERVQPDLGKPLNAKYLQSMKSFVSAAADRHMLIVLDMHNFARRGVDGKGYLIDQTPVLTKAHFADAWVRLATEFKNYTNIFGYDIMNEPYDMDSSSGWLNIAQAAIHAIRKVDKKTPIIICGDNWASASEWLRYSDNLKTLHDPSHKIIYEAHVYFDHDGSGVYKEGYDQEKAYPMVGVERVKPFASWLRSNHKVGLLGEYGIPNDDPRWEIILDKTLHYIQQQGIPGTYWSAGPRWGDYKLSVQPLDGYQKDRPQMKVLEKYKRSKMISNKRSSKENK